MKIVVTGATGYIGERFIRHAVALGHQLVAFSRRRPTLADCDWIPYDLSLNQAPALPADTDVILHLATSTSSNDTKSSEQEVLASSLLIEAARAMDARFIFVSSQTTRPDATAAYGRTKWRIEQNALSCGGWVVRAGQVYGGAPRGAFGELVKIVQRLPVLPAFWPAPTLQPIHVDDLVKGLLRLAQSDSIPPARLYLGAVRPVTFTYFLRVIASCRLQTRRIFVFFPRPFVFACIRLIGRSLRNKFGLERLRSLFDLPVMDTAPDLGRLELQLRPLTAGMHPSGSNRRRQLFTEGYALLSYVLGVKPSGAVLRRYVRMIEKLRGGRSLTMPSFFLRWPIFLALIDDRSCSLTAWGGEFLWRVDAVTVLAEANPLGEKRFLGLGEHCGFIRNLLGIFRAAMSEALWRVLGVCLAPVVNRIIPCSLSEQQ